MFRLVAQLFYWSLFLTVGLPLLVIGVIILGAVLVSYAILVLDLAAFIIMQILMVISGL